MSGGPTLKKAFPRHDTWDCHRTANQLTPLAPPPLAVFLGSPDWQSQTSRVVWDSNIFQPPERSVPPTLVAFGCLLVHPPISAASAGPASPVFARCSLGGQYRVSVCRLLACLPISWVMVRELGDGKGPCR